MLQKLEELRLPFKIPAPVLTSTGETLVQLEANGKFACLFRYIEGDSPAEEEVGYYGSFGMAAGLLSIMLSEVNPGINPVYRPYYELRQAYPLCSNEVIRELCLKPSASFVHLTAELEMLYMAYADIADSLPGLEQLPHQLVHGDLNASNLLLKSSDHRQVAALLDFEFCTYDLRAMEPAVILSGLLGHPEEQKAVRDFCRSFTRSVHLTDAELTAIPALMLLRKVDVFLHFVTRYLEQTDEEDVLQEQVKLLSADVSLLSAGAARIQTILQAEQETHAGDIH